MIRLRIFHPGRRVWKVWSKHSGDALDETWISPQCVPSDWQKILGSALDLIWLENTCQPGQIRLNHQHGFIQWHEGRRMTKINVRLENFSPRKRSLIAAALLKAARFHLLEEG
jgi:hypothetical protein